MRDDTRRYKLVSSYTQIIGRSVARCVLLSSPDWNLHSQFSYQGEGCSPAPGNQLLRTRIGHLRLGWYPSGPTMPDATSGPTMPDASTDSLSFV